MNRGSIAPRVDPGLEIEHIRVPGGKLKKLRKVIQLHDVVSTTTVVLRRKPAVRARISKAAITDEEPRRCGQFNRITIRCL